MRHRETLGRARRRWLLGSLSAVLIVAAGIAVSVVWRPSRVPVAAGPRVELTTSQVAIGRSYRASAAGFVAGEQVRFTWTGPTNGVMGAFVADGSGHSGVRGPIVEQAPPGDYQITATGLRSGLAASAALRVTAGGGPPSGQGE